MTKIFHFDLTHDHPIIKNHRVKGNALLPGLAYIDMIYQIIKDGLSLDYLNHQLKRLVIFNPLLVKEGQPTVINLVCTKNKKFWSIQVEDSADKKIYLMVEVHKETRQFKDKMDIASFKQGSSRKESIDLIYDQARLVGLVHDGIIKAEGEIYVSDSDCLMDLRLNAAYLEDAKNYLFHPTLIDGAGIAAAIPVSLTKPDYSKDDLFLPLSIESFYSKEPIQNNCVVRINRASLVYKNEIYVMDMDFYNAEGHQIAQLKGLTSKLFRNADSQQPQASSVTKQNAAVKQSQRLNTGNGTVENELRKIVSCIIQKNSDQIDLTMGFFEMGLESSQLLGLVKEIENAFQLTLSPSLLFEYSNINDLLIYLEERIAEVGSLGRLAEPSLTKNFQDGQIASNTVGKTSLELWASVEEYTKFRENHYTYLTSTVYPCLAIDRYLADNPDSQPLELSKVSFEQYPITSGLTEKIQLELEYSPAGFQVSCRAGERENFKVCCAGRLGKPAIPVTDKIDIDTFLQDATPRSLEMVKSQLKQHHDLFTHIDPQMIEAVYEYGPSTVISRLNLTSSINSAKVQNNLNSLVLSLSFLLNNTYRSQWRVQGRNCLPESIERIIVYPGAADTAYLIINTDMNSFDALLVSESGEILLEIIQAGLQSVSPAEIGQALPVEASRREDIAIIGLAGKYPGAKNVEEFWDNLKTGKDSITEIPENRWDWKSYFDADKNKAGKIYSKWGGFIDGVDEFDPLFFNISPREAETMDPQERLFLECAYETMEDAGYSKDSICQSSGSGAKVGVYVGVMYDEYQLYGAQEQLKGNMLAFSGSSSTIANRVSYILNFNGPSMAIDTACSSSLTAIHLACQSLSRNECEVAIAGGVNVSIHPNKYLFLSQGKFVSSKGRCESFGKGGDGYVPGEGVGAVLLKPLSKAVRDGDHIYGVIKGSLLNAGGKTSGYTVPNPAKQSELIKANIEQTGINARSISYIETHGTGTSLGDPIEIAGLNKAFSEFTQDRQFCAIGSVKSNIGHCESASGISGLTKVLLQLKYKMIVPSLHSEELNPNIDFSASPFYVQQELTEWKRPELTIDGNTKMFPRIAALSSFGAGGANAHIILTEYEGGIQDAAAPLDKEHPALIILSAHDKEKLLERAQRLISHFDQGKNTGVDIAGIAYTLQNGREAMDERIGFTAATVEEMLLKLKDFIDGKEKIEDFYYGQVKRNKDTVSLFTSDEDLKKAVMSWISKKKFSKLLDLWVKGLSVDWAGLYPGKKPYKVSLPVYPFAREKYWIVKKEDQHLAALSGMKRIHPLIHENTSDFNEQKFTTQFTGNEFFLTDHRVEGFKVLPGVAYLEMVRSAVASASGLQDADSLAFHFRNIVWTRSFIVEDQPVSINTGLFPDEKNGIFFEIYSWKGTDEILVYSQGKVEIVEKAESETIDLESLRNKAWTKVLNSEEYYNIFNGTGIEYGPAHRGINSVSLCENEALAKLEIPIHLLADAKSFVLHPSIMDSAFQATVALLSHNSEHGVALPFALDDLEVFSGCTVHMWAAVSLQKSGNTQKFNINLMDETGKLCVRMQGLTLKSQVKAEANALMLLEPVWMQDTPVDAISLPAYYVRTVILCEPDGMTADDIKAKLPDARVITLQADVKNGKTGIDERYQSYAVKLIKEIQGMMHRKLDASSIIQMVVFSGAEMTLFTGLSGVLKSAQMENSKLICQLLEVEAGCKVNWLVEELNTGAKKPQQAQVKYSQGKRLVMQLQEVSFIRDQKTIPWKNKGVYLITGGLGGLGQIFAHEITVNTTAPVIILTGRSPLIADKKQWVHSIEKEGAVVEYHQLDVTDRKAVEKMLQSIEKKHGKLDGILHSAGVIHDSYILEKSVEEAEEVLGPKVLGTRVLDETSSHMKLDLFLLFSSIAGLTGNRGQSDYAAANAFMDGYAAYRNELVKSHQRSGQTISINWPLWKDGGMSVDKESEKMLMSQTGMAPLETRAGVESLYNIIALDRGQVLVISGNRKRVKEKLLTSKAAVGIQQKAEPAPVNTMVQTFDAELTALIMTDIVQLVSDLLKVNRKDIDVESELSDYGFDSITFTELANQMNQKYRLELSPTLFFEYPVIRGISKYLVTEFGGPIGEAVGLHKNTVEATAKTESAQSSVTYVVTARQSTNSGLLSNLQSFIQNQVSEILKVKLSEVDLDSELNEYGFDSITFTELANKINQEYSLEISPALFFEQPTIRGIVVQLAAEYPQNFAAQSGAEINPVQEVYSEINPSLQFVSEPDIQPATPIRSRHPRSRAAYSSVKVPLRFEPIAIVGVSGMFPGAEDINEFWKNLIDGKDCISEIPSDRWDWKQYFGDPVKESNKTNSKWGGFIKGAYEFDPLFFGISPKEAGLMDPQQRLLMTFVWKAIEDAGYSGESISGTKTGIFMGTASSGYGDLLSRANVGIEGYSSAGLAASMGPNRMSYFLNIHGPSEPIDTACSSSLVAIHRAVGAITDGSCDMALAGGINTMMTPYNQISFSKAGMLSEDGRCKTFSDKANGYVRGEGVGVLFLKRLKDAEESGDHIYGVIRSTVENHGGRANSLTAPNPRAQVELLVEAYKKAGIDPMTVSYIEAHGTGTPLGDPIEINALKLAFKELSEKYQQDLSIMPEIGIGSVKSNIGHLELAAGVAGVIKVLMQLKYKTLVKSLHCETVNPFIQLKDSPFYIVQTTKEWPVLKDSKGNAIPRRAGISSFGFGGVNAHVVIEEYTKENRTKTEPEAVSYFVLSAKYADRLKDQAKNLLDVIVRNSYDTKDLRDIAYTLQVGRDHMDERLGLSAVSIGQLQEKLNGFLNGVIGISGLYQGRIKNKETVAAKVKDQSLDEKTGQWILENKIEKILELWVNGIDFDWKRLYTGVKPGRLSLPPYAFSKEKFLVKGVPAAPEAATLALENYIHPLLHKNNSNFTEQRYTSSFTGSEPFFKYYSRSGKKIFSCASYLEMARVAIELAAPHNKAANGTVRLNNVVWAEPLAIAQGPVELNIGLARLEDNAFLYEVYQGSCTSVTNILQQGSAEIVTLDNKTSLDMNASLNRNWKKTIEAGASKEILRKAGIEFNDDYLCIDELYLADSDAVVKLRLPSSMEGTIDKVVQQSMLLESAVYAALIVNIETGINGLLIPQSLDSILTDNRPVASLWGLIKVVRVFDAVKIDLDLYDSEGRSHSSLKGLSFGIPLDDAAYRPRSANIQEIPVPQTVSEQEAVSYDSVLQFLSKSLADALFITQNDIDPEKKFVDMGLDSIVAVEWIKTVNKHYQLTITTTKVYDYPNVQEFSSFITDELNKNNGSQVTQFQKGPLPPAEPELAKQDVLAELTQSLADALFVKPAEIVADKKFIDLGLDSIVAVEWNKTVNKKYDLSIPATKVYDYPCIRDFADFIAIELGKKDSIRVVAQPVKSNVIPLVLQNLEAIKSVNTAKVSGITLKDAEMVMSINPGTETKVKPVIQLLDDASVGFIAQKPAVEMIASPQSEVMSIRKNKMYYHNASESTDTEMALLPITNRENTAVSESDILNYLTQSLAEALFVKPADIDADKKFIDLGLDSIVAVEWIKTVNKKYDFAITATKVYDYPCMKEFTGYIKNLMPVNSVQSTLPLAETRLVESSPVNTAELTTCNQFKLSSILHLKPNAMTARQTGAVRSSNRDHIAIVGMSGRYPKAKDLKQYWDNLMAGVNAIREIPANRWDIKPYYDPQPFTPGKIYCKWLGSLDDIDQFDAEFFNISPIEAVGMDPQHRLFLQESFKAFEDAGYSPKLLSNKKCGVYLGIMNNEYGFMVNQSTMGSNLTGNNYAIGAARLPYFLNLKGPAIPIDTACSSSLVATHLAYQALANHEIDMALIGGVTLYLGPDTYVGMCSAGMLSQEGKCKTFDNNADGFVPGEGVGAIVLKRLSDAERDHDHIYGVIIASGINQDGKTNGITAPSVLSQIELERDLYEQNQIDPESISYVEMHGTGTKLGDPIELEALSTVYQEKTQKKRFCAIGSVKSNIGHTSAASGVASIQKVLLSMQNGYLPPTINYQKPNEHFNFQESPFYVNSELTPWSTASKAPKRAGVSAFGFSGTNAHLIIQEYHADQYHRQNEGEFNPKYNRLFVLSAKKEDQLRATAEVLKQWVINQSKLNLSDMAYTLQVGRDEMEYRLAFVADSKDGIIKYLEAYLKRSASTGVLSGEVKNNKEGIRIFDSDEDMKVLIEDWIKKGKLQKVAEVWVKGLKIGWESLYKGPKPYRISLPTYSFAKQSYWVDLKKKGQRVSGGDKGFNHPLLQTNASSLTRQRYTSVFQGDESFCETADKSQWKTLSAGAYIEMIRAAVESAADLTLDEGLAISMNHIQWGAPFIIGDKPASLQIELAAGDTDNQILFEINQTGNEPGMIYQQGSVEIIPAGAQAAVNLNSLMNKKWTEELNRHTCVDILQAKGVIQQSDQCMIEKLFRSENEVLVQLSIPETLKDSADPYKIYPAMINSALQGLILASPCVAGTNCLPSMLSGIDELLIQGSSSSSMFAVINYSFHEKTDSIPQDVKIEIYNEQGHSLITMAGLSYRTMSDRPQVQIVAPNPEVKAAVPKKQQHSLISIQEDLTASLADALFMKASEVDSDKKFMEMGLDSIIAVEWIKKLNKHYHTDVSAPIIYDYPNISEFSSYLLQELNKADRNIVRETIKTVSQPAPLAVQNYNEIKLEMPEIKSYSAPVSDKPKIQLIDIQNHQTITHNQAASAKPAINLTLLDYNWPQIKTPVLTALRTVDVPGYLSSSLAEALFMNATNVDLDKKFIEMGMDSIIAVEWIKKVNKHFGTSISAPIIYDYPSINELAGFLMPEIKKLQPIEPEAKPVIKAAVSVLNQTLPVSAPIQQSVLQSMFHIPKGFTKKSTAQQGTSAHRSDAYEKIAIVGISGRYPQAHNLHQYWENLEEGKNSVQEIPSSRWNMGEYYDPNPAMALNGKIYCKWLGLLDDVEYFDPLFFNIAPSEAEFMDPQHRLFLQEGYKAFEDAGYGPQLLSNSKCGVYLGIMNNEYGIKLSQSKVGTTNITANGYSIAAARIPYFLNLKGPAIPIDTACSSSLVATYLAIQALSNNEIDLGLVGGVTLYLAPETYVGMCSAGMLSPEGQCKTFDNSANGFVPGEGVGAIVVKRLKDAKRDHDHIYGVIIGSGINQDGKTNGITAPSMKSQIDLERGIYGKYNIDPESISYVEMHGTGTKLGDPIELKALSTVYQEKTSQKNYCAIGSVKSNIGHTSAASGVASIHKVLLSMQNEKLAPTLHFTVPNEHFNFDNSPFYVNTKLKPWKTDQNRPKRAGVSAFGFSGTNAHIIIEEYSAEKKNDASQLVKTPLLFVLSAKREPQLHTYAQDMKLWIENQADISLQDMAYTLQVGRDEMEYRLAFMADSKEAVLNALNEYLSNQTSTGLYTGSIKNNKEGLKVFNTDEDNQHLLGDWIASGKMNKIAELWVKGLKINWETLYSDSKPYRMSLPTYPFARERCWVDTASSETYVSGGTTHNIHPLVHQNTSDFTEQSYSTLFSGLEPFFTDHKVNGYKILPGAVYIEMARKAVESALGLASVHLSMKNIVWSMPFIAQDKMDVLHITLMPVEDHTIKYEVFSEDFNQNKSMHNQGFINFSELAKAPEADLKTYRSSHWNKTLTHIECYKLFASMGLDYGPAYRGINNLYVRENEVFAELTLPESVLGNADQYFLHPSMLDSALQTTIGFMAGAVINGTAVPYSLDTVDIFAPCMKSMLVIAKSDRQNKIDIDLCDTEGKVCVRMKGLTIHVTSHSIVNEVLMLEPHWKEEPIAITDSLKESQERVIVLCEPEIEIVAELTGLIKTARFMTLDVNSQNSTVSERFQAYSMMLIDELKSIMTLKPHNSLLIQLVVFGGLENALFSGLAGILKTARLENPAINWVLIELEESVSASVLSGYLNENAQDNKELHVKYLNTKRYTRTLKEIENQFSEIQTAPWKDGGIYLITGGIGGLGRIFAEAISNNVNDAVIILTGRSALKGDQEAWLNKFDLTKAKVVYWKADVNERTDVDGLIQGILAKYGRINGIIHSAGVIEDNYIIKKTPLEVEAVLRPKVSGLVNLDEASKEESLDLFLLVSSVAGILGNIGQADYSAANAFMDAYAHYRNSLVKEQQRYGFTVSINWPLWKNGGMVLNSETEKILMEKSGISLLNTEVGLSILYHLVSLGIEQALVFEGKLTQMRKNLAPQYTKSLPAVTTADPIQNVQDDIRETALQYFKKLLSGALKMPGNLIETDAPFENYGIDSIMIMQLTIQLEKVFGPLSKTLFFEYQDIGGITGYFIHAHYDKLLEVMNIQCKPVPQKVEVVKPESIKALGATLDLMDLSSRYNFNKKADRQVNKPFEIAIIGLSGRYPGADDLNAFWDNLSNGVDSITEIPVDRWDWREYYQEGKTTPGKTYSKWGGFINGVDEFDPLFFNILPKEAEIMDPQERLFLESVYKTLEDAGYTKDNICKSNKRGFGNKVGVFAGVMYEEYQLYSAQALAKGKMLLLGGNPATIANRVSYVFNFHGPSMVVETMCSSSLTAIHLACQSIERGDCETAIAGGVNVTIHPMKYLLLSQGNFVSSKGRCESFGKGGDGYVPGEGVGTVLLKPLHKAIEDGDHIYGVIKGSMLNAGGKTNGYTIPSPAAQAEVIIEAIEKSGVNVRMISYIEAHGTGTSLGDPIEITGLSRAFEYFTQDKQFCSIGSVKSNIGHCESAAGISALTKVLLQMKYKKLVPNLHSAELNPNIDFVKTPFVVQQGLTEWERPKLKIDGVEQVCPRIAGISSFGAGGANAHMIIEEYSPEHHGSVSTSASEKPVVIVLSAKNKEKLRERVADLLTAIKEEKMDDTQLSGIAYTLQTGRESMDERVGFTAYSILEAVQKLEAFLKEEKLIPEFYRGNVRESKDSILLFTANEEMQEVLGKWIFKRKYNNILELWVKGLFVDWDRMVNDSKPVKMSLPTYRFAREKYWAMEKDIIGSTKPAQNIIETVTPQEEQTQRNSMPGNPFTMDFL